MACIVVATSNRLEMRWKLHGKGPFFFYLFLLSTSVLGNGPDSPAEEIQIKKSGDKHIQLFFSFACPTSSRSRGKGLLDPGPMVNKSYASLLQGCIIKQRPLGSNVMEIRIV